MARGTKQQKLGGFEEQDEKKDPYEDLLMYHKTIRIAVSGDVMITRLEREIIDTPEFQRLRGIRQLGQVYLALTFSTTSSATTTSAIDSRSLSRMRISGV